MGRHKSEQKKRKAMVVLSDELRQTARDISPKGSFSEGVCIALEAYGNSINTAQVEGAKIETVKAFDASGKQMGIWKKPR